MKSLDRENEENDSFEQQKLIDQLEAWGRWMRELVIDGIALNKAKANKLDLTSEGLELTTDKVLSILDEEDQKENVDP